MKRVAAWVLSMLAFFAAPAGCAGIGEDSMACANGIMYSWHLSVLDGAEKERLTGWVRQLDISTLYQDFDDDFLSAGDDSFITKMDALGVEVMHLGGDPEWARKPARMIEEIDKVLRFNSGAQTAIAGIVFDVEPHAADGYEEPEDYLLYAKNLEQVYSHARENGLYMVVVLPYWLERVEDTLLPDIIGSSDEISVMNYYTSKTTQHISDEVSLARQADKPLNTIYELDFDDEDTFDSLEEIQEDFKQLYAAYEYSGLRIAYHHFGNLGDADAETE